MKVKKRQKLCYNCEGEIDLDVIVCPFCAADLREEKPERQRSSPYSPPQPLYPTRHTLSAPDPSEEEEEEDEPEPRASFSPAPQLSPPEDVEEEKPFFAPTLLLALGAQLFLFGLILFFFSDQGTLTLRWNGSLWFCYLLASGPLLYFGYKKLYRE